MRSPGEPQRSGRRLALGGLALVAALLAGAAPRSPTASGWVRIDLWSRPALLLRGSADAYHPRVWGQAADLPQLPEEPAGGAMLTAPRVRALRQQPSTLSWHLRLGAEPYLSFTPLADSTPCPSLATVSVAVPGGAYAVVWSAAAPLSAWPAGPEVVIDLGRWAGKDVEVQFDVRRHRNGDHMCGMVWGSPEVVFRGVSPSPRRNPGSPPNLLLIGADTLRADALGAWGRRPSVTPALDALAAESDVWLDAFSTSNATNPSFASIHTGLFVHHHGVRDLATRLPAEHVTLAERLAAAGYDTHAVFAAQHLNPEGSGLGQGFASVAPAEIHSAARLAVNRAIGWLQAPHRRPFFLWLHLYDPHTPHLPPAPFALGERPARLYGLSPVRSWIPFRIPGQRDFRVPKLAADRDLYLSEVAYLDREMDRLLDFLRSRGTLADTVVAFVSDHGENLEDHDVQYRHAGLWDTTTHVPLMIRWPDRGPASAGPLRPPPRRLRGLVQTIDLHPTLLAAAGLRPGRSDAQDLRRLVEGGRHGRPAVFADQADGTGASVRTRDWRYFLSAGSKIVPGGAYLYDLRRDPGELVNLAGKGRREEADLLATLREALRGGRAAEQRSPLTAEEEAALRALGYE